MNSALCAALVLVTISKLKLRDSRPILILAASRGATRPTRNWRNEVHPEITLRVRFSGDTITENSAY
jgi:hypothetical protein